MTQRRFVTPYSPPGEDHGADALSRLNPLMGAWVTAKVETGKSNTECARLAGYTGSADTLKATGYRVSRHPGVLQALFEECHKQMRSSAAAMIKVAEDIALDETADQKDRLRAASIILDRSGFGPQSEHKLTVEHRQQSRREIVAELKMLAERTGLDLAFLAGPGVIDADFEPVGDLDGFIADLAPDSASASA